MGIEKIYKRDFVSNYFSGVVALADNDYEESYNFLKSIENLETTHLQYSRSYVETLVNNFKINEGFRYSINLKKKKLNFYSSDIIIASKYIKNNDFLKAYEHLNSVNKDYYSPLQQILSKVIFNWIAVENKQLNFKDAENLFQSVNPRYKNIKKINDVFLNCYFDTSKTDNKFKSLINEENTDFSRYTFFYVNYLIKKNLPSKAKIVLNEKLKNVPRNLILNQLKLDIFSGNKNFLFNSFDCKNISNIIAEVFYITANALSTQSIYSLSNFYINLSKYLNQNFISYNTLLAENMVMTGDYEKAKLIYKLLSKSGEIYNWHSTKQLALIELEQDKKNNAERVMENGYIKLKKPNIYQTYDLANFFKNNQKFNQSIKYYSKVINKISESHELYPKAKDGRGISYERVGEWQKAEKDFLDSLRAKPNQAYVINYLAYTWIEKGIKIEKSLKMLEEANRLKKNDGYITDSLGWALYKLEEYKDAKRYLQKAVQLMPSDPIVNDHFGDVLWKTGKKIQARYYWDYVLNLEETEDDLKKKIKKKMLNGPEIIN